MRNAITGYASELRNKSKTPKVGKTELKIKPGKADSEDSSDESDKERKKRNNNKKDKSGEKSISTESE